MARCIFAVQSALDCDGAILVDEELALPVATAVNVEGDLGFSTLVGVRSFEGLERLANFCVFVDGDFYVGFLKYGGVVVDVTEAYLDPGVGHVGFVIVVVVSFVVDLDSEAEAL